jgi:hypothetical protein
VPLVLLIDEADLISGPAMVSFLRQLRGVHDPRRGPLPHLGGADRHARRCATISCRAKTARVVNPGSPFNIKAASLTLRNFSAAEVATLVGQHTEATGQAFSGDAVAELARVTDGQPFLVNALARICVTALVPDRGAPVTAAHVDQAREQLILARTTHLDSLGQRLREPRVAKIVQAVLLGDEPWSIAQSSDDFQYAVDLGLIRRGPGWSRGGQPDLPRGPRPRAVERRAGHGTPPRGGPGPRPSGRLDMPALLAAFRQWWRENADVAGRPIPEYPEAVPHLALCGFLQRVVNGGGRVHREFAAGRGAMDLLISYGPDRFAIELKRVRSRDRLETVVERGAAQLGRYLDTVGLDMGWLVVFDVRPDRSWEERLWTRELEVDGKKVVVLGA